MVSPGHLPLLHTTLLPPPTSPLTPQSTTKAHTRNPPSAFPNSPCRPTWTSPEPILENLPTLIAVPHLHQNAYCMPTLSSEPSMEPIPPTSLYRIKSLTRSTSSPNLVSEPSHTTSNPSFSSLRPRTRLSRAYTSHELTLRKEDEDAPESSRTESQEEDESNAYEGLAEDLEKATKEHSRDPGGGQEDWKSGEMEGETTTDSIHSLILPSLEMPDDDSAMARTSDLDTFTPLPSLRPFADEDDEEDSQNWSPEVYTLRMISKGAGGGRTGEAGAAVKGKRRVMYDVPEEAESWSATAGIATSETEEVAEGGDAAGANPASWNFEKQLSSRLDTTKRGEMNEKKVNRKRGRTRAVERLKAVENHLSWSISS